MRVYLPATEEVLSVDDFVSRKRSEGVSFPREGYTAATFEGHGAHPILETPQPTPQPWQFVMFDGVEEVEGNWQAKYKLGPEFDTEEEEDAYVATWEAAALKAQTPSEISYGQFFTALWKDGERITYEEALAAVSTRTIPAELDGFLNMLASFDEAGARDARLLLSRATVFHRDNYLVPVFGSMYGMSETDIDALWRLGATL